MTKNENEEDIFKKYTKKELDIIDRYFGLQKWHFVKEYPDTMTMLEKLFDSENCPFCGSYFKGNVMMCDDCDTLFCDRCDDDRSTLLLDGKFCPDCMEEKEKKGEVKTIEQLEYEENEFSEGERNND